MMTATATATTTRKTPATITTERAATTPTPRRYRPLRPLSPEAKELAASCAPLAYGIARKYHRPGWGRPLEDLIDVAVSALLRAAAGHDPAAPDAAPFRAFAAWCIHRHLRKSLRPVPARRRPGVRFTDLVAGAGMGTARRGGGGDEPKAEDFLAGLACHRERRPEDRASTAELVERVRAVLPADLFDALHARHYLGLSDAEIGRARGHGADHARHLLRRAARLARERLPGITFEVPEEGRRCVPAPRKRAVLYRPPRRPGASTRAGLEAAAEALSEGRKVRQLAADLGCSPSRAHQLMQMVRGGAGAG